jgi:hypothetical protein
MPRRGKAAPVAGTNRMKLNGARATSGGYEAAGGKLMTIIIGQTERAALKTAMARGRAHPVPWDVLQRGIVDRSGAVHIDDRPAVNL